MTRTRLTGLILALVAFGPTVSAASAAELAPGDPAPPFKLPGSDGKTYQLADFQDRSVVVLAWFPKAFTGGCTIQCRAMREEGELLRGFEVAYFTASCDTPEENRRFAESLELDYPILSDPERKVARAYGVVDDERPLPRRWTFIIGKDGTILDIDREVNVATHATDVARRLEKLGVAGRSQ